MSNESTESESEDSPALARNSSVDAVVAVLLFIFGAVVAWQSNKLGASWSSDGPGAGYFPFYIGLIICIAALGVFYQSAIARSRDGKTFVNRQQMRSVLSVLIPASVYVLAVVFVGLYVASAVYIALFMVVLGKYKPAKSVFIGVAVSAAFFLMFEVWFKVPLFKGSLDPLRFLGY